MAEDEANVMTCLFYYSHHIFAKEKEFYSANEAYILLLVEEDGWGINSYIVELLVMDSSTAVLK